MASENGIYKHHCISFHFPPSYCLLLITSNLPSNWKIHHTNGKFSHQTPLLEQSEINFFLLTQLTTLSSSQI